MRQRWSLFRDFLERNRVFFETVAALLLSVMAVIVASVQAWVAQRQADLMSLQTRVAEKQTDLMTLQTRIAEVQVLPFFSVLGFAGNNGFATWEINNTGAAVRELRLDTACFVRIEEKHGAVYRPVRDVPVFDCLGSWGASQGGVGTIARASGFHKTTEVTHAEEQMSLGLKRQLKDPRVSIQIIFGLRYRDILDRDHETYFTAATFGGSHILPRAEGAALIRSWNTTPRLDFDDLTADGIAAAMRHGSQ